MLEEKRKADLIKLKEELKHFSMTRDEILSLLLSKDGKTLNKMAPRNLIKFQESAEEKSTASTLRRLPNEIRWKFILREITNTDSGLKYSNANLTELINAYAFNVNERPICCICGGPVTFFRFHQPYGKYCGASCQLKDPSQQNKIQRYLRLK